MLPNGRQYKIVLEYEARNYPTARTLKREKIFNNRTKPACFILRVVRSALISVNYEYLQ